MVRWFARVFSQPAAASIVAAQSLHFSADRRASVSVAGEYGVVNRMPYFDTPLYNHLARLDELGVTVRPDLVVDDHADPVNVVGGAQIAPPVSPLDGDREMLRIYDAIRAFAGARS